MLRQTDEKVLGQYIKAEKKNKLFMHDKIYENNPCQLVHWRNRLVVILYYTVNIELHFYIYGR